MQILNKYKEKPEYIKDAIYIGRGSALGNPFVIGPKNSREQSIKLYRTWLEDKIIHKDQNIIQALKSFKSDSKLLCFCAPCLCHGDIIKEFWEEITSDDDFQLGLDKFIQRRQIKFNFVPSGDGHDHINIYSKGKTLLGKALSNFADIGFEHPEYGRFKSMEGYWYWTSTGMQFDELRDLYGYQAKLFGLSKPRVENDNFNLLMETAIRLKIEQNTKLRNDLLISSLPLSHYYCYGNTENFKIISTTSGVWLVEVIERLRLELKNVARKIIIAGSRTITDYEIIKNCYLTSKLVASEIVSGAANGVDKLGEQLATELNIPIKRFVANWDEKGKSAGYIRNAEMAKYGDLLIAFWDGASKGTKHMIDITHGLNKPVLVITI